jgi:hypothetical protein
MVVLNVVQTDEQKMDREMDLISDSTDQTQVIKRVYEAAMATRMERGA